MKVWVAEEVCINDDTYGDSGGDTCSDYYVEGNESGCGNYDTDDFISARDCCLCGGGSTGNYSEPAGFDYLASTNYTALYNYTYHEFGSISGENLYLIENQTVEQCMAICDADPECMSFEYGMAYDGPEGDYELGDC